MLIWRRSRRSWRGLHGCRLWYFCYDGVTLLALFVALVLERAAADDHSIPGDSRTSTRYSDGWSVEDLPSPTLDPVGCNRPGRLRDGSYLCNPDDLLTVVGSQRVDDQLEVISSLEIPCGERHSPRRIEGGVAVISRMLPHSGAPSPRRSGVLVHVEEFARGVQDAWGIGKEGCDNGFLLLASKEDRNFAISVGSGLEPYLKPKDREAALKLMRPFLRRGDWDTAVLVALEEINRLIKKSLSPDTVDGSGRGSLPRFLSGRGGGLWRFGVGGGRDEGGGGGGGGGFGQLKDNLYDKVPEGLGPVLLIPLVWGLANGLSSAHRRRYNAFEAKLKGIEAQRAMVPLAMGTSSVVETPLSSPRACPICLESFSAGISDKEGIEGGGGEVVGADGRPTVMMQCGHEFCHSCLERWHDLTIDWRDDPNDSGAPCARPRGALCPICDETAPFSGDPRLVRRRGSRCSPAGRRSRVPSLAFSWNGMRRGNPKYESRSAWQGDGINACFGSSSAVAQPWDWSGGRTKLRDRGGHLRPPRTPPPPPPAVTPPPPLGGIPGGAPLTPVENAPAGTGEFSGSRTAATISAEAESSAEVSLKRKGPWGSSIMSGGSSRERARREAAFRLASLRSQYPKFLDGATVDRWLSKDYTENWARDAAIDRLRPPVGERRKGSGWASSGSGRPHDSFGERKSFDGGSSSSATGGSW